MADFDSNAFLQRVVVPRESGGNYQAVSPHDSGGGWGNAAGKYQFRQGTLRNLGYTGSEQDFLNSPQLQDQYAQKLAQQNYNTLAAKFGRAPTDGEMYAAWHYGAGDVQPGASLAKAPAGSYIPSGTANSQRTGASAAENTGQSPGSGGYLTGLPSPSPAGTDSSTRQNPGGEQDTQPQMAQGMSSAIIPPAQSDNAQLAANARNAANFYGMQELNAFNQP